MIDFTKEKDLYLKNKSVDRSKKGSIDKQISALVNRINSLGSFYTTSSCSGRIMLFSEGISKDDSEWIWVTHEKADAKCVKENITAKDNLIFRMEGAILHICAKSLADAQELIDLAKQSGFKRSGIIATNRRFMLEIISTENIDAPIIIESRRYYSDEYIEALVSKANDKLKITWKKIDRLYRLLALKS